MSATTAPQRNMKSRLPTSNSINNMASNRNEMQSNGISSKKSLSVTNILHNHSSDNAFHNRSKKPSVSLNKAIRTISNDKPSVINHINKTIRQHPPGVQQCNNGTHSNKQSTRRKSHSPPCIFHAIAPAPISRVVSDEQVCFSFLLYFININILYC